MAGNDLYVVTSIDTGKTPDGAAAKKGDGRDAPEALHQFVVICVDRSSGKVRWKKTVAEMVPPLDIIEIIFTLQPRRLRMVNMFGLTSGLGARIA